jgi:hypothetical protein
MNADVEELLREGLDRLTAGVRIPPDLLERACVRRRRRLARRGVLIGGMAAVTAAALVVVTPGGRGTPARTAAGSQRAQASGSPPGVASGGGPAAHAVAYVIRRVEHALAGQRLVFVGQTTSAMGPSITWAYGPRHRWVEFTGSGCGHALPNGECTRRGSSEPYLAQSTALIGSKLTGVYVTFFDRKWSRLPAPAPASACSVTGALEMGGPPVPANHWANFINATLACGAAHVDGHAWIDGVKTTKITGSQVAVKLSPGYGKTVRQKRARVRWALYVNPKTYLPVRIYGSTQTFGGLAGSMLFSSVTDVRWLPPTAANIAQARVTIPAGFRQVSSPASQ